MLTFSTRSSAGAITTFELPLSSCSEPLDHFNYSAPPGPNAARQSSPHPHQVILDPTGRFLVSPDLGSDVVHISAINATTGDIYYGGPYLHFLKKLFCDL